MLIAVGAMGMAIVLLLIFMLLGNRDASQRARRLARVTKPAGAAVQSSGPALSVKRSTADSSIAAFDQLIKRLLPNPAKLRTRLAATGYKTNVGQYLIACLLIGLIVAVFFRMWFGFPIALAAFIGIIAGVGLPHFSVSFLMARRLKKFLAMFAEAIDLIVRGLKSGLPVSESIKVVATELKDPVSTEFGIISDSVKFGMSLNEALWAAAPRLDVPEFRFFIISLSIQQETGGNLAETLENLSNVIRRRRQMKLKIKALSSEAKASAYIIGSLPFLMFAIILVLNYNYAMMLFRDPRGLVMVGVGFLSYIIGIGVMIKMVRFEI
jgi:tight adherence protein B